MDRVRREKKETGILLSPKKTMARGPYKPIDEINYSVKYICIKIEEKHTKLTKKIKLLKNR